MSEDVHEILFKALVVAVGVLLFAAVAGGMSVALGGPFWMVFKEISVLSVGMALMAAIVVGVGCLILD